MSKLGDAIRLGKTLLPHTKYAYVRYDPKDDSNVVSACAVGMACYALGWRPAPQHTPPRLIIRFADQEFVTEHRTYAKCPDCNEVAHVLDMCTHLNDEHDWGPLEIAAWVDRTIDTQSQKEKADGTATV